MPNDQRAGEGEPVVTRTTHDTYACADDLRLLDERYGCCRTYECRTCFVVVMDDDDVTVTEDAERCMYCGDTYPRWWAPTELFLTVIGGHDGPSLLCIGCFTTRAEKIGIRLTWRPMLDDEANPFIEADTAYAFAGWQATR